MSPECNLDLKRVLDEHSPIDVRCVADCQRERLQILLELAIEIGTEANLDRWELMRILGRAAGRAAARGTRL